MTRRHLIFKDGNDFLVSQEFNGDKNEFQFFQNRFPIDVTWNDSVFTLDDFRNAECLYTYDRRPLTKTETITFTDEMWM